MAEFYYLSFDSPPHGKYEQMPPACSLKGSVVTNFGCDAVVTIKSDPMGTQTQINAGLRRQSRRCLSTGGIFQLCVCFFVSCNGHWFNRVPGANLRIVCLPSALTLTLAVPTYPLTFCGSNKLLNRDPLDW
jgi:hypothetical protein